MLLSPVFAIRRLSARLHRLRVSLATRGWRGMWLRLRQKPLPAPPEVGVLQSTTMASSPAERPIDPSRGHVLLIDASTPRPDHDSGSMRAVKLMALLLDTGYAVDFLPDDRRGPSRYTRDLVNLGVTVHFGAAVGSYPAWLARNGARYDAVIVSRYHLAEALFPLLRRLAPQAIKILDTVDLHHVREEREASHRRDRRLARLARGTRRRELRAISRSDATWVVSPAEVALLQEAGVGVPVHVVPNLHEVAGTIAPLPPRSGLLFVGGAAHPPNVDAVVWLVTTLFPAVRRQRPDCRLHLVGDGLERVVAGLPDAGVITHGHVPDLAPLLDTCRIGLAPLRFGAGVKGKVNLCMAAGLPVVLTSCAAEGMHLVDGEDALLADTDAAFVDHIVRLSHDDTLWWSLAHAGQDNVRRHFSLDAARPALAASLGFPGA
ncbi:MULTISPECIES: glycosyltransferase [Luteimonas]|uniref:glycosyltransferase n=1 Tax=Luteimonas TaxID=83614 RepID=UPI00117F147C|nr:MULTISPECIES: glycosyltransferase [Luteimonas]